MDENILFSIIIPTYNRAEFVVKAINSFLDQIYSNFEVIVIDDGSTDDTRGKVAALTDKRVRYYFKNNGERGAARNFGVHLAKGQYINFFDSDDFSYRNHLLAANNIISNTTLPIFHLGYHVLEGGKIVNTVNPKGVLNKKLLMGNILSCNNVFLLKEIALLNPFSEDRSLSGSEDWLLWLLLSSKYDIIGFDEITSVVVQHGGRSMSLVDGDKTLIRAELVLTYLFEDKNFAKLQVQNVKLIRGSLFMLVALNYALVNNNKNACKYLILALRISPLLLFTKRPYAVLKYMIRNTWTKGV